MNNPIIDNRIVSSKTFAVRFKMFLENIPYNWWTAFPYRYEEYNYMLNVAKSLLEYQKETATDENEIDYLKRMTENDSNE